MNSTNPDLGKIVSAGADLVTSYFGFGDDGPEADAIALVCSAITFLAEHPQASMEDVISWRGDDPAKVRTWWNWEPTATSTDSPAPAGEPDGSCHSGPDTAHHTGSTSSSDA